MKTLLLAGSIVLASAAFSACASNTDNSPATVKLSANSIQLSTTDTVETVDASLSCMCPCKLTNMMMMGDTDVIRFDMTALQSEEATHHITAMAQPSKAKPGTYSCTFSFVMHDPMEMGGMHDYASSVTATFTR